MRILKTKVIRCPYCKGDIKVEIVRIPKKKLMAGGTFEVGENVEIIGQEK